MAHGAQIDLRPSRAAQRTGAAFAVVLHVLAATALLSYEPARSALFATAPLMVQLISPPRPEAKPPAEPPKPKPVVRPRPKPPEPLPLVTAPIEAPSPSPILVPPPPPPPPPEPAPVVVAPPPLSAPIYNADYLDNPAPIYPPVSKRNGEQGIVTLRVLVNPAGRADEVQVRTSSGYSRLDEAARDTVRGWRFVPAKRGDEPVAAWVLIPISFGLDKS
jgi:periplasmic protein TonB